ncbi:MAG: hypothetical protein IJC48_04335 [Clostridia bacterium]|nr:hypothetical protein [Clostridia bacterium]
MSARLRALTKKYLDACKSIKEATEAENEKDDCSVWTAEHINAHAEEFYYFNTYL